MAFLHKALYDEIKVTTTITTISLSKQESITVTKIQAHNFGHHLAQSERERERYQYLIGLPDQFFLASKNQTVSKKLTKKYTNLDFLANTQLGDLLNLYTDKKRLVEFLGLINEEEIMVNFRRLEEGIVGVREQDHMGMSIRKSC